MIGITGRQTSGSARRDRKSRNRVAALVAAAMVYATAGSATAGFFYFDPYPPALSVGDTFDFNLWVGGLTDSGPQSLKSYTLDVAFDSTILAATGVTFGTELGGGGAGSTQSSTISAGSVLISEVSLLSDLTLDTLQPDSFLLATIAMEAIGPGLTAFTVGPGGQSATLTPPAPGKKATAFKAGYGRGTNILVEETAIPAPGLLAAFVPALAALILARRRRAA